MTSYRDALAAARRALGEAGVESAGLDARLLLADAVGLDTAALIARGNETLGAVAESTFNSHLKRRLAGEPVARIVGAKEFWGLSFLLNEATLVPRPETEILVETVLAEARARLRPEVSICDLGTGSGAIAIALLSELPEARALAVDVSEAALQVARRNAERIGVAARMTFRRADFAEAPEGNFDIVVSNPPYVASAAIAGLARDVRDYDPRIALDGGPDGLSAYRAILARAPFMVRQGGMIAFETGHDQGSAVADLCRTAGFDAIALILDLAGTGRVITGTMTRPAEHRNRAKKALGKVEITS